MLMPPFSLIFFQELCYIKSAVKSTSVHNNLHLSCLTGLLIWFTFQNYTCNLGKTRKGKENVISLHVKKQWVITDEWIKEILRMYNV